MAFFLIVPPTPPTSTLFPYTTLFRSPGRCESPRSSDLPAPPRRLLRHRPASSARAPPSRCRSEEHTSELQSRGHLVCRLLLEKKKLPRISQPSARHHHLAPYRAGYPS